MRSANSTALVPCELCGDEVLQRLCSELPCQCHKTHWVCGACMLLLHLIRTIQERLTNV